MKVRTPLPAGKIADYVDRILIIEHSQVVTPFTLPLYANGVPNILFLSTKAQLGKNSSSHLTLFGQTVFPELLTLPDNFILIAYFLKPYSLIPLFGVSALELTDKPLDLHLLFPKQAAAVREKLLNAATSIEMTALLDDFIFDIITKSKPVCDMTKYASSRIAIQPSKESLVDVQKELHITERTFQRMFERNVGLAPNLYRRICQFNAAFVQLNTGRNQQRKLSDIALQHGYADQSHYIRAFREFTSITPKEYLRLGSDGR